MGKFLAYLNEGRTKLISHEVAFSNIIDKCSKNYKKMFNSIRSTKIYRGVNYQEDFGYIDSNKGKERQSANTYNYYTLLIDNLPSWKNLPKRSRGLVCTTDTNYAKSYGFSFYIIPYDDAKIGVCPSYDFWESFHNKEFQRYFYCLSNFNDVINDYLFFMLIKNATLKKPENYKQLKDLLIEISRLESNDYIKKHHNEFFNRKDIMKHLNDVLSPSKNGFKMGIENISKNKEVWIQGKSILLSNHGYEMLLEDLHNHFWG